MNHVKVLDNPNENLTCSSTCNLSMFCLLIAVSLRVLNLYVRTKQHNLFYIMILYDIDQNKPVCYPFSQKLVISLKVSICLHLFIV